MRKDYSQTVNVIVSLKYLNLDEFGDRNEKELMIPNKISYE